MSSLAGISLSTDLSKIYPSDVPLVLIVHTHGTEAYSDPAAPWYDPEREVARSSDKNKNVVHIGRLMADILNENGISTIHCDVMHDAESYSGSYERSAETVKKYLSQYPSIKYIIDVHRDAVVKSSGELVIKSHSGPKSAEPVFTIGSIKLSTILPKAVEPVVLA